MSRAAIVVALISWSFPALAETATICGRPADLVSLLIDMQKPTVEGLWRDKKMFVNRDTADGSVWVFSLAHTSVHPAAFCRRTVGDGAGAREETGQICTASEKACASFVAQANERLAKLEAASR